MQAKNGRCISRATPPDTGLVLRPEPNLSSLAINLRPHRNDALKVEEAGAYPRDEMLSHSPLGIAKTSPIGVSGVGSVECERHRGPLLGIFGCWSLENNPADPAYLEVAPGSVPEQHGALNVGYRLPIRSHAIYHARKWQGHQVK